ncbi:hypothetical protein [Caulobacter sp. LARHSG274]
MIQHRAAFVGLAATVLALANLAGTSNARAQDVARGSVSLGAEVGRLCVLGAPSPAGVALGQISASSGASLGRLAAIPPRTVQLPGSFCNYAGAALAITASPLAVTSGVTQPGFAGSVNYTCTISAWGATAATVRTSAQSTTGTGTSSTNTVPKETDLTLVMSDFASQTDDLLQPGAYLALVTITLGPDAGLTASGS